MPRGDLLGTFELLVLLTLQRLGGNVHGMAVRQELEDCTRRPVAIGAVYATLDRLERKALRLVPRRSRPPERRGRARRFFQIEGAGSRAITETRGAIDATCPPEPRPAGRGPVPGPAPN